MLKEVKDLFVKDLRENPPQTMNCLYDGKGYCCLGRLHVILGGTFIKDESTDIYYAGIGLHGNRVAASLPYETMTKAGFKTSGGEFDKISNELRKKFSISNIRAYSLIQMNDFFKLNFLQIAEVVDEVWEQL